jgi:hypothetical protein
MPRRSHAAWALKMITDAKEDIGSAKAPKEWGRPLTLHHKISKTHLDWIEQHLQQSLASRELEVKEAAEQFWKTAQYAAGKEITKVAGNMQKTLWNMPVNVEIGPSAVAEDPGTRFDPNTEPVPQDADGRRRLTPESAALLELERIYLVAYRARREPDAKEWLRMADQLRLANEGHEAVAKQLLLAPPRTEQWLEQVGDDADAGQDVSWQRKRLRRSPGVDRGVQAFQSGRAIGEVLGVAVGLHMAAPLVNTYNLNDSHGVPRRLELTVQPGALTHMCRRHTYQHFDFAQAKLVNTFWPVAQVAGAQQKHQKVVAAQRPIAEAVLECMELDARLADWDQFKVSCVGVPVGADTMFFIAIVDPDVDPVANDTDRPTLWKVAVKTVAPDGESATAYTSAELEAIDDQL